MKAIIYTRFSPRRNEEDCESTETQSQICREYCENKGYEVEAAFHDEAVSGASKTTSLVIEAAKAQAAFDVRERPALWQAVDQMKKGMALVVWRMDRLARDALLAEILHRTARSAKWRIEATNSEWQDETPASAMMRQILSLVDEYERGIIAERTSASMQAKRRNGRIVGGIRYGFQEDAARAEVVVLADGTEKVLRYQKPHDREQKILALMIKWHAEGATAGEITRRFNSKRIGTRKGTMWDPKTIRRIIAAQD